MSAPPMFAIGSPVWPGLSKLTEEAGEVQQVIGKLMGTGGQEQHWDGSNLRERLIEEMGDNWAALQFVAHHNRLDPEALERRRAQKLALFNQWHGTPVGIPPVASTEPPRLPPGHQDETAQAIARLKAMVHVHQDSCYGPYQPCDEHHQHDETCGARRLICHKEATPELVLALSELNRLTVYVRQLKEERAAIWEQGYNKGWKSCAQHCLDGSLPDNRNPHAVEPTAVDWPAPNYTFENERG